MAPLRQKHSETGKCRAQSAELFSNAMHRQQEMPELLGL